MRDPSAPLDAVRVMTAHGSKGLQAPLVILADATTDPTAAPRSILRWTPEPGALPIPVFPPRADERGGPLDAVAAEIAARELAEHWRLFYVAATRAEEQLVVTGALGKRAAGLPPMHSWYATCARAMTALGVAEVEPGDGQSRTFLGMRPQEPVAPRAGAAVPAKPEAIVLPDWVHRPAPRNRARRARSPRHRSARTWSPIRRRPRRCARRRSAGG